MAIDLITTAASAGSAKEIANSLVILRAASIHILATTIFNDIPQGGPKTNDQINIMKNRIQSEIDMILKAHQDGVLVIKKVEEEPKLKKRKRQTDLH